MERDAKRPDIFISPTVGLIEQWQEALSDDDLANRFNELVTLTQQNVDPTEHAWVTDAQEVSGRWQHLVSSLGSSAISYGHPLMRPGTWMDQVRVAEVLEPINYRSLDANFVENALILAHSLATTDTETDNKGLAVRLNTINNVRDNNDPQLAPHFIKTFDLRDMAEPISIIGDMTYEGFARLSETERDDLLKRIRQGFEEPLYGNGYGWTSAPQQGLYFDEFDRIRDYIKIAEYGTTNEQEISTILDLRKALEVAELRSQRPDFGQLPLDFDTMSEELKDRVETLFEYFYEMRSRHEHIGIDTHSLANLDMSADDIEALKAADVLTDETADVSPGGPILHYNLATRYYECWVSSQYPKD